MLHDKGVHAAAQRRSVHGRRHAAADRARQHRRRAATALVNNASVFESDTLHSMTRASGQAHRDEFARACAGAELPSNCREVRKAQSSILISAC
jgi:hypothetical protein